MMQTLSLHSLKQLPLLGMSTYWCLLSTDNVTEISVVPEDIV